MPPCQYNTPSLKSFRMSNCVPFKPMLWCIPVTRLSPAPGVSMGISRKPFALPLRCHRPPTPRVCAHSRSTPTHTAPLPSAFVPSIHSVALRSSVRPRPRSAPRANGAHTCYERSLTPVPCSMLRGGRGRASSDVMLDHTWIRMSWHQGEQCNTKAACTAHR